MMRTADLPEDMRVLLADFCEKPDSWSDNSDIIPEVLPVVTIPLAHLPDVPLDPFDRGEAYALEMEREDVPPIIICSGLFIDGKHRVWAARRRGDREIEAIDISQHCDPEAVKNNQMGRVGLQVGDDGFAMEPG
jgi:hypothetical protein